MTGRVPGYHQTTSHHSGLPIIDKWNGKHNCNPTVHKNTSKKRAISNNNKKIIIKES
jgi:hypothetical protein